MSEHPRSSVGIPSRLFDKAEVSDSAAQHAIDEDIARWWARRPAALETVLLLEPDETAANQIAAELSALGIQLALETEPFRAIARAALGEIHIIIASAHLGAEQLGKFVTVVREEISLPVLLAHGVDDADAIRSAVLAGARPVISLPYESRDVARALRGAIQSTQPGELIDVGDLRIVPDSHKVSFAGRSVDLSSLELEVLIALARNRNGVIHRTVLVRALWPEADPVNANYLLGAAVSRIRRKFRTLGIDDSVHTIRGLGYRLDLDVLHRPSTHPDVG